eukprot:137042-Ditylum_brightwellii.AAC.1
MDSLIMKLLRSENIFLDNGGEIIQQIKGTIKNSSVDTLLYTIYFVLQTTPALVIRLLPPASHIREKMNHLKCISVGSKTTWNERTCATDP